MFGLMFSLADYSLLAAKKYRIMVLRLLGLLADVGHSRSSIFCVFIGSEFTGMGLVPGS